MDENLVILVIELTKVATTNSHVFALLLGEAYGWVPIAKIVIISMMQWFRSSSGMCNVLTAQMRKMVASEKPTNPVLCLSKSHVRIWALEELELLKNSI